MAGLTEGIGEGTLVFTAEGLTVDGRADGFLEGLTDGLPVGR